MQSGTTDQGVATDQLLHMIADDIMSKCKTNEDFFAASVRLENFVRIFQSKVDIIDATPLHYKRINTDPATSEPERKRASPPPAGCV